MEEITKPEKEGNKKEIKTDLFRFATLRGPQSITKERRKLGFVEHANYVKSAILKNIKGDDALDVIKGKLALATSNFNPFSSVEEVKQFAGDLWIFSMWLGKNQNNLLNTAQLSSNALGVSIPIIEDHLLLWDNVFYDLVTRANPHVRQACLQLLVAIHFLENYSTNRDPKDYGRIAKSRVIVPTFFTAKISSSEKSAGRGVFQQRTSQEAALKRQAINTEKLLAGEVVKRLLGIKKELIDLNDRYHNDYKGEYEKALSEYKKTIEISQEGISIGKATTEKTDLAAVDPTELRTNTVIPFVFDYPKPLSKAYTSRKLSFEASLFIDENRMSENTVSTAVSVLEKLIDSQNKIAKKAVKATPGSVLVGGVKMKTKSAYIPTYSIVTQVISTAQRIDLKVFLSFNTGYANAFLKSSGFRIQLYGINPQTIDVTPQDLLVIQGPQPDVLFVQLKVLSFTKSAFDKNALISVVGEFQLDNDK